MEYNTFASQVSKSSVLTEFISNQLSDVNSHLLNCEKKFNQLRVDLNLSSVKASCNELFQIIPCLDWSVWFDLAEKSAYEWGGMIVLQDGVYLNPVLISDSHTQVQIPTFNSSNEHVTIHTHPNASMPSRADWLSCYGNGAQIVVTKDCLYVHEYVGTMEKSKYSWCILDNIKDYILDNGTHRFCKLMCIPRKNVYDGILSLPNNPICETYSVESFESKELGELVRDVEIEMKLAIIDTPMFYVSPINKYKITNSFRAFLVAHTDIDDDNSAYDRMTSMNGMHIKLIKNSAGLFALDHIYININYQKRKIINIYAINSKFECYLLSSDDADEMNLNGKFKVDFQ